ncbi:MAG TPA: 3'-5' exonuclease [Polyangiaceae bacterium]|nr:3'-5' exonuclease [Polyangiaceae bacterium]
MHQPDPPVLDPNDTELTRIVIEEEQCLARVLGHLRGRGQARSGKSAADYETEMLALRDEIATARLEDVPPLLEQMERLQSLAAHRRETIEGQVDARSPYFGHLVLQEGPRRREVLIGRSTYLDTQIGVRIVDWRDAPVSRIFYRYAEGAEYDENFGGRDVSGEIVTRRSVTIVDGKLRRIGCPQGTFVRTPEGWHRLDVSEAKLRGGQGTAARSEQHHRPGKLGTRLAADDDKVLKEITPLIDARQFELITRPDSGLVVIQGGAGSGKTTIGLHRLAYLAYNDPRRFRSDRMLVVVFNDALARYMADVLPALGVQGVAIRTYQHWVERLRSSHLPRLPSTYSDDTPSVVTRMKKHPAMLGAIDAHVARLEQGILERITRAMGNASASEPSGAERAWTSSAGQPFAHRVHAVSRWLERESRTLTTDQRVALERVVHEGLAQARDVVSAWFDILSDRQALAAAFTGHPLATLSERDLDRAHTWCAARAAEVVLEVEERAEMSNEPEPRRGRKRPSSPPRDRDRDRTSDDDDRYLREGVDGKNIEQGAQLDREDDTLLLKLWQRLRGPLRRGGKGKEALVYEHVFVDEAQDLSPVELGVVLGTLSRANSLTLAGDIAQRLHMDNGFTDWNTVLGELGLSHVEIEPLRVSYRSTQEIIEFSRAVLGPLAHEEQGIATRSGAPVELFGFAHSGDAVGFLAEILRELMQTEPRASVALIVRYPEQADVYYQGLEKAEVPNLRRIAEQDFPFKAGVDVTDVRQVKGLEFDYVVLLEVSDAAYPADDEARHLLHIAATRAAHQLWVLSTGRPSPNLPEELRKSVI